MLLLRRRATMGRQKRASRGVERALVVLLVLVEVGLAERIVLGQATTATVDHHPDCPAVLAGRGRQGQVERPAREAITTTTIVAQMALHSAAVVEMEVALHRAQAQQEGAWLLCANVEQEQEQEQEQVVKRGERT